MTITPVSFSDAQLQLIAELCPVGTPPSATVWNTPTINDLKAFIKSYYIAAQQSRCCYCDQHLASENHRVWDIDHIVPRSTHPRFTFEPRNLAAACPDCNIAKRDTRVLKNNARKTYPSTSADFKILHPHIDKFSDHIFRDRHLYLGKTEKGKQTIYTCDLLRFAQKYIDWTTSISDERFEGDVDSVVRGGPQASASVHRLASELQ